MPGLRLAAWTEPGWKRKGVVLLELEAGWRARLVGVPSAFLLGAHNRVPGEESELKEWVKAEAEEEEWIWVQGFPKVGLGSLSKVEQEQVLEQKAVRPPLSTVFLLRTNSSIQ